MSFFTNFFRSTIQHSKSFINTATTNLVSVRYASKKVSGSSRNSPDNRRPKHRGWRVQDGHYVRKGTILAVQMGPRFHPGLYVGLGHRGTLYALEEGKVMVTCERINPNMSHTVAKLNYAGRENSVIYKKHFNVIPNPHHDRFVLIDRV